jgi:Holliday junction resolvase-like predicted endonuclease
MSRAIAKLEPSPAYLLLDAVVLSSVRIPQKSIIKGDSLSQSIAAASIAAKVARDRMMDDMDAEYPGYGFARHKGYGTREHIEALKRLGPCVIHRASFAPVRTLNPPLFALDKRATGTQGEDIAAQLLKASGYEIIGRNVRIGRSEIDIVASIGGTLVFVEVRARHGDAMGMPEESLSRSKQTHMVTAAQRYLAEHGDRVTDWRIDLVAIDLGPNGKPTRTEIIEYAVDLDS